MSDAWNVFRNSATAKLVIVGVLLLVMLIPLSMVESLTLERSSRRAQATHEIAQSWGNAQTIGGPMLVVPLRYSVLDQQGVTRSIRDVLYVLPRELTIEGDAGMQVLNRGIYQVPVYTASLSVTGSLRPLEVDAAHYDELEVLWQQAEIALPISDPRSLRSPVVATINGETLTLEPGADQTTGFGPTLKASLAGFDQAAFADTQDFSFDLTIAGTGALGFRPDGDTTRVSLASDWASPSFNGGYLPDERTVADSGFEASWQILGLGRGYPSTWRNSERGDVNHAAIRQTPGTYFGVEFLVPVDVHTSTLRAIKYAELYLAVTFAAFFIFEVTTRTRLHPVQYLSVGLANGIFYLLLLALSEHAGFGPAYLASAIASTALISGYAAAVLGSTRRALPMTALLSLLYLYLYTTLRAEDFALLAGALGLFALLTAFMYLTRTIDWYEIELSPRDNEQRSAGTS